MFHRLLCRLLRVEVRRLGAPSAEGPRLIVSNHVSWLDIPVLGAIEPMTFLAKKEIGGPLARPRRLADLQGVVYVDRQRKRSIPKTNADMAAAMRGRRAGRAVRRSDHQRRHAAAALPLLAFRGRARRRARALSCSRSTCISAASAAWSSRDATCRYRLVRRHDVSAASVRRDRAPAGSMRRALRRTDPGRRSPDRKALARATEAAVRGLKEQAQGGGG